MAKTPVQPQLIRLSTKGRLVIPKQIRERHGWIAGTELLVEDRGDAVILRKVANLPTTQLADLVGCAGYKGPAFNIEEMDAGIARGARERR